MTRQYFLEDEDSKVLSSNLIHVCNVAYLFEVFWAHGKAWMRKLPSHEYLFSSLLSPNLHTNSLNPIIHFYCLQLFSFPKPLHLSPFFSIQHQIKACNFQLQTIDLTWPHFHYANLNFVKNVIVKKGIKLINVISLCLARLHKPRFCNTNLQLWLFF